MDMYCAECGGTVNSGSACPRANRPDSCPLSKTEKEHYDNLAKENAEKATQ